jgi:LmbE family N-acetylglucosaminyl deacetylase
MRDAAAHGFPSREAYAAARRHEFLEALKAGRVTPTKTLALGYPDQEASLHLVGIARRLAHLFEHLMVDTALVHPYEGGHPDHDARAFAVHAARLLLPPARRPRLVEFTSYHASGGRMVTGVFLPNHGSPEFTFRLDQTDQARKERMLACYRTQQAVVRQFENTEERFRPAPRYDFESPPHAGRLLYEPFPWELTATRWLSLAQIAWKELGLC